MKTFYRYSFVFRFHNLNCPVSYELRNLTVKDARKYFDYLNEKYDFVFMFKQFD
nr:MAG TPA: hypothetical protein [Microviridae sp.]